MNTTVFLFSALLAQSLISTQALAGDIKTLPGSACGALRGSDSSNFNKTTVNSIRNMSNLNKHVSCPIVRDKEHHRIHTTTPAQTLTTTFVLASHENTTCYLRSRTSTGRHVDLRIRTGKNMTFSRINGAGILGSYNLICRLPRYGHIYSYSYVEN